MISGRFEKVWEKTSPKILTVWRLVEEKKRMKMRHRKVRYNFAIVSGSSEKCGTMSQAGK